MSSRYPEEIHPKEGVKIIFDNPYRAKEYLEDFKIVSWLNDEFIPLNLKFDPDNNGLMEFLVDKGIYSEIIDYTGSLPKPINVLPPTMIDTSKIYEVEVEINKYLHNYKFYSVNEVADMLSFSRPTLYKIIKEGKLKTHRIYNQLRIKHSDLADYIKKENE